MQSYHLTIIIMWIKVFPLRTFQNRQYEGINKIMIRLDMDTDMSHSFICGPLRPSSISRITFGKSYQKYNRLQRYTINCFWFVLRVRILYTINVIVFQCLKSNSHIYLYILFIFFLVIYIFIKSIYLSHNFNIQSLPFYTYPIPSLQIHTSIALFCLMVTKNRHKY